MAATVVSTTISTAKNMYTSSWSYVLSGTDITVSAADSFVLVKASAASSAYYITGVLVATSATNQFTLLTGAGSVSASVATIAAGPIPVAAGATKLDWETQPIKMPTGSALSAKLSTAAVSWIRIDGFTRSASLA